jgi:hypothetical protein
MSDRLVQLEREVRTLKRYAALATVVPLIVAAAAFRAGANAEDVLRVRGIIVVDAAGRERILIGAPVPETRRRVRTDTARARAAWGHISPRYMEHYANYRHAVHGMVVLDEEGFDRLALGDSVSDPNIGPRIGPGTGLTINDPRGYERAGFQLLALNGKHRASLGLDTHRGREGVFLIVDDGGRVGVHVEGGGGEAFLGAIPPEAGTSRDTTFGLVLRDRTGAQRRITVAP